MVKNNTPYKTIMNRIFNIRDKDISYNYRKGKNKFKDKFYKSQTLNRLTGYRAYLISLLKYNEKYQCIEKVNINEYNKMIREIEKQIHKIV